MKQTLETSPITRGQRRIAALALVAGSALVAFALARSAPPRTALAPSSSTSTSITVFDLGRDATHAMMGTFSTEKLKVTGTGSDSIVGSGGMQLAGSASFANGSTLYGVTITSSTNHAGNALALKAVDNTQDGASLRFLRSDGTIRWSLGNNSTIGTTTHDLWLFDNTNVNYALYLNPATTSYLRMGLSNGRLTYDDTTHGMALSTNGTTRLTVADALITSAVALDMGTHLVNNVVDPVSAQDAATKNYVDTHSGLISGLTTNTIPKATSATSIGNSSSTDDGTTVAIGGAGKLEVNYSTNSVDWRGGFLSILSGGSLVIGNSGGIPVSNFLVDSTTGDVSTAGSITVPGGTVNLGTGSVIASAAGTISTTGAITADSGLRVFDVAGNGLTSSSNTVEVAAAIGGGITVNADSIQMTFCAANQIPQMNAGGTAWSCAAASSGTIAGSATSPGVIYASGANTAATDATAFTYNASQDAVFIGTSAVTAASTLSALDVSTGISGGTPIVSWATSTSGFAGMVWNKSDISYAGSIGYGNSAVSVTALRGNNFFASGTGVNYVFNDAEATGTNLITMFMTSGSTGTQWTNGSSGAVGASGTGKLIYNNTTKTFRASLDGGAFTSIVTGAVALNTIPKSANGTTGALTASSVTDDGTTFAINANKLTVTEASGNTNIAGTLDAVGAISENGSRVISAAGTGLSKSTNTLTVNIAGASCSAGQAVTAIGATGTGTCSAVGATESTTAPTLSSCGTGPTVSRANNITFSSTRIVAFTSVMGTGSPTSCTATFASAFSATPTCTVFYRNPGSPTSAVTLAITSVSSSAVTYDSGGFPIETTFVHCIGPT